MTPANAMRLPMTSPRSTRMPSKRTPQTYESAMKMPP